MTGAMDYASYWGMKEKPFEESCDTRFYYESEDHREALDRMLYIVKDRNMNMGMLTGEVGSGKTITKNVFQSSLPADGFEVVNTENSNYGFVDLMYDVLCRITFRDSRLALEQEEVRAERGDKYGIMKAFEARLQALAYDENRHLVVLFDEAQQMEDSVLDEIKNLTNLPPQSKNILTVFLVGQPELREKVRRLKQVDQRIFLRFHLNNLSYDDTVSYVLHRLRAAGLGERALFTSLGLEYIFRSTGGVPREINRLCKMALTYGAARELSQIRREELEVIFNDLQEHA